MLAIEGYGRWWRRDRVFWGTGGKGDNRGHLKGFAKGRSSVIVDFRDQIGTDVLFNENRDVVYVEQAGIGNKRLFGRLNDHRFDHLRDRWTYFSWFRLRGKNPKSNRLSKHHRPESWLPRRQRKDARHETEAVLMAVVEPPLNKRGPNWTGSIAYRQYIDLRVPPDMQEIVSALPQQLQRIEKQIAKIIDTHGDP